MARPYGKLPRRLQTHSRVRNAQPQSLRVRISKTADLEAFSLELQKMVARLQDGDVHSVGKCALYLELNDASGGLMTLRDGEGRAVEILDP